MLFGLIDPANSPGWNVALPTAITAISTLYLRLSTGSTVKKAKNETQQKMDDHSSTLVTTVQALEKRVAALETQNAAMSERYLSLAQKHSETMTAVHGALRSLVGSRVPSAVPPAAPSPQQPQAPGAQAQPKFGKVEVVDIPPPPLGKVIRKP